MESMSNEISIMRKIGNFGASLGACLMFIYVFLPFMTRSVDILDRMSHYLDNNGIDPTRYYYTDVVQVKEAENYLETTLDR